MASPDQPRGQPANRGQFAAKNAAPVSAKQRAKLQAEANSWVALQVTQGDLDRVAPSLNEAGGRLNEAREWLEAARTHQISLPRLAIACAHDATRKAITAHMIATGVRVRGEGSHKMAIDYASVALKQVISEDDIDGLWNLRAERTESEYGAPKKTSPEVAARFLDLADRVVAGVHSEVGQLARAQAALKS